MAIVGPWAIAVYGDTVNWGAVPGPDLDRHRARGDLHLQRRQEHRALLRLREPGTAWDVLKFATSEEQDGKLLELTGQMPLRTTCGDYADYFEENPEYVVSRTRPARTVEVPNVAELDRDLADVP